MTLPDLSPEEPEASPRRPPVEGVLIALILVLGVGLGAPELVRSLRGGSVDLGAVFYPVMVAAIATMAWTRRARQ